MSYKVIWDKKAYEDLNKLEQLIAKRIAKIIKEFAIDPTSKEVKRLKGEEAFRLRLGDYRIILDIDYSEKQIKILKIGHRKNIYER